MEGNEEKNFEKIKVFSSDDEKLKKLGELLSNQSSRDILKLLIDKEMYTNEIAEKLDLRVNLIIHHLKKLESLGLLEISEKQIVKKGNKHKFYKMIPNIFITPSQPKGGIKEDGFLKKNFKEGIKFLAIGVAATSSFIIYKSHKIEVIKTIENDSPGGFSDASQVTSITEILYLDPLSSVPIVLIIIGLGLFLIFYNKKRKN